MLVHDKFLIGSQWQKPSGSSVASVISPSTEEVVGSVPVSTPDDIDRAVAAALNAHENGPWGRMSFEERASYLLRLGESLSPRLEEITRIQANEMGGPYSWLEGQTGFFVDGMPAHVEEAARVKRREIRTGDVGDVLVTRDPIGVVAGIVPWNAPITLLLMKLIPSLMGGCPIVLKPAPESPLSAYLVGEAAIEAGLPDGVLSIVPGGREVGEHLVTHPDVNRVSFTGSTAAGARVASLCGNDLKNVTLELGGKSAAIILDDADMDSHIDHLVETSMGNSGQMCIATTRILVPKSKSAGLTEQLVEAVKTRKLGDPQDRDTFFGPLVAERQRERVEDYVRSGESEGAKVALGGGRPADRTRGWYVEPTVFTNVSNQMRIAQEEIFGPVLSVIEYESVDEAVEIANDSAYGLGGRVYTTDVARGVDVAARVQTGTIALNDAPAIGGGGPFGGVKQSGLGRERGPEGSQSYYTLKSIALPEGYGEAEQHVAS